MPEMTCSVGKSRLVNQCSVQLDRDALPLGVILRIEIKNPGGVQRRLRNDYRGLKSISTSKNYQTLDEWVSAARWKSGNVRS